MYKNQILSTCLPYVSIRYTIRIRNIVTKNSAKSSVKFVSFLATNNFGFANI